MEEFKKKKSENKISKTSKKKEKKDPKPSDWSENDDFEVKFWKMYPLFSGVKNIF